MTPMPWFRVYSEILDDRKIKRICKKTGHSKALVIGVWIGLLAIANNSPDRGVLSISEDMPVTLEDLEDELGLPGEIIDQLIDEFASMGMINGKATLKISNWEKRQFKSDNSTERVREYREKRSNVTLPKRYSNVIDTDTDTDTEQIRGEEEETATTSPIYQSQFQDHRPAEAEQLYRDITGQFSIPSDHSKKILPDLIIIVDTYDDPKKAIEDGKDVFKKWCETKSKTTGKPYSRTNPGWVTWWLEALAPSPTPANEGDAALEELRRLSRQGAQT
jgi:hypothetical protein